MLKDRYDLPVSSDPTAGADYIEGVDLLLAGWPGAEQRFQRALERDPRFALACAALARLGQIYGRLEEARRWAAKARTLGDFATPRERGHIEVIALLLEGQPARSYEALGRHLEEFPRDAVPLSLALGAFGLIAFSGRVDHDRERLALCDRLAKHYGDDWWFLGQHGWACIEAGELERGRRMAERSLALRRENAHAAHPFVHSFFEAGDDAGGSAFLENWLPGYDRSGQVHHHLLWHLALFELERGRPERALELYARRMRPEADVAPPLNVLSDSASLLWRFRLGDESTALAWAEIADFAKRFPHVGVAFIDIHCAMAEAAAGDVAALDRRVLELRTMLDAAKLPAGSMAPSTCRALGLFARRQYDEAIRLIESVLEDAARMGGSRAQREIIEDTLIVACLRDGRLDRAKEILSRRLARRPSKRDSTWLAQTKVRL